jgi:hypothetical protein
VIEAISAVFLTAVDSVFTDIKQRPVMPAIDVLHASKTVHQSLGPISHDESTNAGNLNVLNNIFRKQYRLSDDAFTECLYLIYSDQKTTTRI